MIMYDNPLHSDPSADLSIKISASGDAICGTEWQATELSPPYSRMYYMLDGSCEINCDGGELTLEKGKLYLIPAGYPFSYSCKGSMRQLYFHVDLISRGGYDHLRSIDRVLEMAVAQGELNRLTELYHSSETIDALLLRTMLTGHLIAILKQNEVRFSRASYSDPVRRALKVIGDYPMITLSVGEIAERCYTSADNLAHRFKKEVGISVGKYIDELVMFRAEEMLLKTDQSISKISTTLGFCDQFYFSRRFKQRHGLSPQSYRNQRKKAQD